MRLLPEGNARSTSARVLMMTSAFALMAASAAITAPAQADEAAAK
jgi:glycerol transport system substrate-binding protein